MDKSNTAKVSLGVLGAIFSWAVGGLGLALTVLICLMLADYVTGLMVGYVQKDLSSRVGIKGLIKKTYIILLIGAVYLIEKSVLHSSGMIGDGIAVAYIVLEFLSILENGGKLGVNIGPLKKFIKAFKEKEREEDEEK